MRSLLRGFCEAGSIWYSNRSEILRMRSTQRPKRLEVERIKVPVADKSRAGVIIEVSTARPFESVNISGSVRKLGRLTTTTILGQGGCGGAHPGKRRGTSARRDPSVYAFV